jgi:methionyl-tRNA formyltransferase
MWVGGNHSRHLFYANALHGKYGLSGALVESRENMMPEPPVGIKETDRKNFVRHFSDRQKCEEKYFGVQVLPDCETLKVDICDLNSNTSSDFIKFIKPDVVMIFGCGLIKEPLVSVLPYHTINLHLGLSPRYRGSATLFWPFYFMEPWYAGSTFHYIVGEPDAGDIIHQVVPKLVVDDGIHDVGCKTVISSAEASIRLLEILDKEGDWKRYSQKGSGKNFLSSDFRPEHLRVLYSLFDNDMVSEYINGNMRGKDPALIKQYQ